MLSEHDPFVRFHVRRILCGVLPSAKCPCSHPSCVTRNDSFPSTLEAHHVFFGSALEIDVSVQWVYGGCAPQIIVLLSIAQIDTNLTMEACGSLMFIKTSSWNSMIMSLRAYYQHHEHEHNRTVSSINDSLTIELNYLLNWITRAELNNSLNWNLGNQNSNIELNQIGYCLWLVEYNDCWWEYLR